MTARDSLLEALGPLVLSHVMNAGPDLVVLVDAVIAEETDRCARVLSDRAQIHRECEVEALTPYNAWHETAADVLEAMVTAICHPLTTHSDAIDIGLLRKLAYGVGGRRTGALKRAGFLEWQVTNEGLKAMRNGAARVRLNRDVRGEFPFHTVVVRPGVYDAHVNTHGAVSVRAQDGELLGLKPDEFEWVDGQETTTNRPQDRDTDESR